MTLLDYLARVHQLPESYKPSLDQYDSVAMTVFNVKMPEILAYEANKAGLESDAGFQRKSILVEKEIGHGRRDAPRLH